MEEVKQNCTTIDIPVPGEDKKTHRRFLKLLAPSESSLNERHLSNLNSRWSVSPEKCYLGNGELRLSDTKLYKFTINDLMNHGMIEYGEFSTIYKMEHKISGTMMAVKYIHFDRDKDKQNQKPVLNGLDIIMQGNTCPYIIQFYGSLVIGEYLQIFMELMDTSLDTFYKFVYNKLNEFIPENVFAYITLVILETLDYLKSRWKIIPQELKPSSFIMSRTTIKFCDFGITGQLINTYGHAIVSGSNVRTYLSPERLLGPGRSDDFYARNAVWSLGIIIHEISIGYYPYRNYAIFEIMEQILNEPSVKITIDRLTDHCKNFVDTCLIKDPNQRPTYEQLLEHPFLEQPKQLQQTEYVFTYLSDKIDQLQQNTNTIE